MSDLMLSEGYSTIDRVEDANLVIINTCHIREHASEKTFSELGRLRELKTEKINQGESFIIAVAGCVAQAEGPVIFSRAPYVDIVVGPQTYHLLPQMVSQITREGGRKMDIDFPPKAKFDSLPLSSSTGPSAFLSIQEGCDKFCSFCVVPYTRGAEYSRRPEEIIDEAQHLMDKGAIEITLLGQNVNAYHGQDRSGRVYDLGELITKLSKFSQLKRIRYTTSHPRDMNDSLIEAHRDIPTLMPYLHLPVQSGSNQILSAMNRQHSRDDYLKIIDRLRKARPDMALSSDFIVGFPGESEEDFEDTLSLIREVGFAQAYSFKYSPRPGTPATNLNDQILESVKEDRLERLHECLAPLVKKFNASFIDQIIPVLFDRPGRRPGQMIGRTPHMQSVFADIPSDRMNSIQNIHIVESNPNSLKGKIPEVHHSSVEEVFT
jgi:tRNA-2-methylthio-N6-dimethylallyladenosine synthase